MDQRPGFIRRIDNTGVPLLLARLFVGGMFAYLSYMKMQDPINFLKMVHQYGVLPVDPPLYLNLTAVVIPWLEMLCAVALLLGVYVRGAAVTALGMLLFFTPMLLIHALGLFHDPARAFASFCAVKFDCGCGTGEVYICRKLTENIALMVGAAIALFSGSRRFCLAALLKKKDKFTQPEGCRGRERPLAD